MSTDSVGISVVIPAYNAAWCVTKAIDSVIKQTLKPAEIIVVNDGSTDDTAQVLASFGDQVRVLNQPNAGLSNARNSGINGAKGKYIAFLDADDYWLEGKLAAQQALLESDSSLGFCSTAAQVIDEKGATTGEWLCPQEIGNTLETIFARNATVAGSGSAVMVRRELFSQVGLFDESLKSLEDIDMWMRLAAVSCYACVPEKLTVILKRSDSMSGNLAVMERSAFQVMKKNRHLLPAKSRGGYWRRCYANTLADYAKWQYREGRKGRAIGYLMQGLSIAPVKKARLLSGLMLAMLRGEKL